MTISPQNLVNPTLIQSNIKPNYKKVLCKNFSALGICKYGNAC